MRRRAGPRRRRVVQLALGEAQLASVQRADALRLLAHALLREVARPVVALKRVASVTFSPMTLITLNTGVDVLFNLSNSE